MIGNYFHENMDDETFEGWNQNDYSDPKITCKHDIIHILICGCMRWDDV
jgi:hypothetical protein